MFDFLPYLLAFVIALFVGVYLGKLLFSARFQSDKVSLEERLTAHLNQLQLQKEQFERERNNFENDDNIIVWNMMKKVPTYSCTIIVKPSTLIHTNKNKNIQK